MYIFVWGKSALSKRTPKHLYFGQFAHNDLMSAHTFANITEKKHHTITRSNKSKTDENESIVNKTQGKSEENPIVVTQALSFFSQTFPIVLNFTHTHILMLYIFVARRLFSSNVYTDKCCLIRLNFH